jgi:hypothetical protein
MVNWPAKHKIVHQISHFIPKKFLPLQGLFISLLIPRPPRAPSNAWRYLSLDSDGAWLDYLIVSI